MRLHRMRLTRAYSRIMKKITINEVGPRDGLQNEPVLVPTPLKLQLIDKLRRAGLSRIECTSFVSPKWVPQMADHVEVLRAVGAHGLDQDAHPSPRYSALVANSKGLDNFLSVASPRTTDVAIFVAASEGFSRHNTNKTLAESLAQAEDLVAQTRAAGFRSRAYLSMIHECPYDGRTDPQLVATIARNLHEFGCYEVSLGDTTGSATPRDVETILRAVLSEVPPQNIAIHAHNTNGQGVANTIKAVEMGISTVDASVAGLGGCPYSPGATGNVCTEEIVSALHGRGYQTGVDLEALCRASVWASQLVHKQPTSCAATMLRNAKF